MNTLEKWYEIQEDKNHNNKLKNTQMSLEVKISISHPILQDTQTQQMKESAFVREFLSQLEKFVSSELQKDENFERLSECKHRNNTLNIHYSTHISPCEK